MDTEAIKYNSIMFSDSNAGGGRNKYSRQQKKKDNKKKLSEHIEEKTQEVFEPISVSEYIHTLEGNIQNCMLMRQLTQNLE